MRPTEILELAAQLEADLDLIEEHWSELREAHVPGARRRWRQAQLSDPARAEMIERDRAERVTRGPDRPGYTSAPLHVDVLDVQVGVWLAIDELAARVEQLAHIPARPADVRSMATLDPRRIRTVRTEFVAALEVESLQPGRRVLAPAASRLHRLVDDVTRVLNILRAGQRLNGAVCPWCRGVTPGQPAGGEATLQVIDQPDVAVICTNPMCDPPPADCGHVVRGRPCWPYYDWEWLAQKIEHSAAEWSTLTHLVGGASVASSPGRHVEPVDHSNRPGVHVMPCPFCVYTEIAWLPAGHEPLPRCTAEVCDARRHRCPHRKDTR